MAVHILDKLPEVGTRRIDRRTGSRRGGRQQRYFLDEPRRQLILARYDGSEEIINELCQRLHVPRWRLKRWAQELGLARVGTKQPNWTDEEIAYIEAQYHQRSIATIAKHLNRTITGVQLKAKRLGINKSGEGYTQRGLAAALGVDDHKIARWRREGWLKGHQRQTERSDVQGGDMWLYTDKHVRKFIIEHPAEIDPRRVDWIWVVDLLAHRLDFNA